MPSKTIVISPTNQISAQLRAAASRIVAATARKLQGRARMLAPVDTGTLKNSIEPLKIGDLSTVVFVGAEYGQFVEFGTRRQRAQPFFTPAADEARRYFETEMRKLVQ
jgi:HK97 gp10 family phage protein